MRPTEPCKKSLTQTALQGLRFPSPPKTGQYVSTGGQCFNAATTDIVRPGQKAA